VIENHAQHGRLAFDDKLTVGDIEGREFSDIPVSVIVEPRDDSVVVTVKYNELYVNSDSAMTLLRDFVDVTASFVSQTSGATIRNVLASDAQNEKHYLLHELETIGQTKPSHDTLVSLFESSVRQNSEATALQTYGTTLSYRMVDQLSSKLAALILLHTRGRQQFIPVLLPRRPQMIISMLAILKAGSAYCPLDLEAPESRLEYLIGTLDSTVILTDDSGYLLLPAKLHQYLRVLNIDNMDWMMDHHEEISLPVVTPASPCYVIFTSGSTTGKPKACVLTHGAVVSSMKAIIPIFQLDANSRVLLFANAIFDASVVDIYGALFVGATLFLVSEDILKTDIAKVVNDLRINFLHMTPTMLQMLDIESCPSLKTVVSGGEQIPLWLKNKFAARVRFIGNYGPTETAVQVATSVSDVPSDEESLYSPTPGNVLVILNSHGRIARQGEPGEVYIGGRQLFKGYLNDKAKTCESLVKIPSLGDHMFYRSGDRGKYTEGMQVQLLSRTHGHLKYLGQRLDPHEIESVLNQAPNVTVTAVVLVNAALFAAVESHSELDVDTVRQLAEMSLPKRLVPLLVQVQKVPQLRSGKIDRRAAAKLITDEIQARQNKAGLKDTQRRAPPSGVVEKTRNVEHRIRDIVNGIVQLPIEDIDKSLSLVGLDSLGFVRLRQEIVRQLDVSISYVSLRKADSVRGVSQLVEESGQMATNNVPAATNQLSTVPAIQHLPPPPSPSRYPAIPSQQSMWMAHNQLSNNSYLVQRVQQVMGHSPTQLISAVMELSHRLVIFRTTFEYDWDDEKLYEVTNEKPNIHLSYDMLKDVTTMKAQVVAWSETVKVDLQQGPLASFRVMEAADGSVYLHSAIHHMLVDEYSSYMIFDALESLLNGSDIGMAFEGAGAHYHKLSHKPDAMLEEWSVRLRGITPFPFRATKKRGDEASRLSRDIFLSQPEQQNSSKSSQINLRDPSTLLTMFQISLHR
jgi:amino acid adenylation domain-containing protein